MSAKERGSRRWWRLSSWTERIQLIQKFINNFWRFYIPINEISMQLKCRAQKCFSKVKYITKLHVSFKINEIYLRSLVNFYLMPMEPVQLEATILTL